MIFAVDTQEKKNMSVYRYLIRFYFSQNSFSGRSWSESIIKKTSFYRRIINTQATDKIHVVYRPVCHVTFRETLFWGCKQCK